MNRRTLLATFIRRRPALKAHTNFLESLGYLRPPLVRSNRIREIAFRTNAETLGEFEELGKRGGEFVVSGWAILPEKHRTADGVLLTYDDAEGEPIIFALAEVGYKRPAVSQRLNDEAYLRSGWTKSWKTGQIPGSARVVRAWTFDAENCRAFQRNRGYFFGAAARGPVVRRVVASFSRFRNLARLREASALVPELLRSRITK